MKAVDNLRDEWGDIPIPFGPFVYWPVVLYWAQLSILLFDKEEICGIGTDRLPDRIPFQMFLNELVGLRYFCLG